VAARGRGRVAPRRDRSDARPQLPRGAFARGARRRRARDARRRRQVMIKINLLPQKRAKRSAASEAGSRDLVIGIASLLGVAAVMFFAVDQPRRGRLADMNE